MNTHLTRGRSAAVLAVVTALLVAGCGGQSDDGNGGLDADSVGAAPTVTVSASPSGFSTSQGAAVSALGKGAGSDQGLRPTEDVFSVLSPWNTPITDAQIAPNSETLLQKTNIRRSIGLNGQPVKQVNHEGIYINTDKWTTPLVADGVPTTIHCRQVQCGDGGDDLTLNIPSDVKPNPLYDGWFSVFDGASGKAYDLWRARRETNGVISYQFMRQWDLDGPGFQRPYVVSARGSGLPLFAGLIRPGELERGQINHALAISLPGPAKSYFIQPASSTDGNGVGSVPEGARIRLRSDFQLLPPIDRTTGKRLPTTKRQRRYAAVLVKTLKTYGAIVVDRAAVPTLYFEDTIVDSNTRAPLRGYELQRIHLDDFVVQAFDKKTQGFPYPPRDQVVDPSSIAQAQAIDNSLATSTLPTTTTPAGGE